MVAFATAAELATHLQTATEAEATDGSPDVLDTAIATQALESASADIRGVCGWAISQETVTDEPYPVERYISLPTLYLTAVAISYDGDILPTDAYTWRKAGTVNMSPWRMLVINRDFYRYGLDLLITYTHGYAVAPAVVKTICLERAGIIYTNPERHLSETRSTVTTVYARGNEGQGSVGSLASDARLINYKLPGL